MKQLCDDLRQFALEVHQLGYSLNGGVGERQCLDLSERMLAAVKQAEARMAGAIFIHPRRPTSLGLASSRPDNRVVKGGYPMSPLDTVFRTCAAYEPQFRPIVEEYCAGLDLEGCFDSLSASQAHLAAVDIVLAVCGRDDPAEYLRQRADEIVASALAICRSLYIAAAVW